MTIETAAAGRSESKIHDDVQGLVEAMKQVIQNVTTQSKINDAVVGRLLALERRVAEYDFVKSTSANSTERGTAGSTSPSLIEENSEESKPSTATARPVERLPLYLGDSTALCRVMNSLLMYVDTRDTFIAPPLLLNGLWEPVETRLVMQRVKAGMRVADIGANWGYYTLLMAAATGPGGRVYAVEPEPRNLDLIGRNLQVNGLAERVSVIPKVALDRKGTAELYQNSRNLGAHTLFVAESARRLHPKLKVEATPLDEVIEGPLDFVKIDAEGSEPHILRGMKRISVQSPRLEILMEFNVVALRNAGVPPEEFVRELKESGYALSSVTPQSTTVPAQEDRLFREPLSTLLLSRANR